jgi:hypothetical protein
MSLDHVSRRVILTLCLLSPGSCVQAQQVLYDHPDAARVTVRSEVVGDPGLIVDLYYPPTASDEPNPAVVFVLGFPDDPPPIAPMKDYGQYTSWAKLVAAEGFVGVLYETSDPEPDLATVLTFLNEKAASLRIDPTRLGLWSCSGNTPLALKHIRTRVGVTPAAFVAYYGLMPTPDGYQAAAIESMSKRFGFSLPGYRHGESYPADLPMLIVRAGRDRFSEILNTIDHFTAFAFQQNLAVTVLNYPEGQHAFDAEDNTEETHAIIKQTLDFFQTHLGG